MARTPSFRAVDRSSALDCRYDLPVSSSSVSGRTPDSPGDPDHPDARHLPPSAEDDDPPPGQVSPDSHDAPGPPDGAVSLWADIWQEALRAGFVEPPPDDLPPDRH